MRELLIPSGRECVAATECRRALAISVRTCLRISLDFLQHSRELRVARRALRPAAPSGWLSTHRFGELRLANYGSSCVK